MTSTQGVEIANSVIENNPEKAGTLVRLLYAFRESAGDPEGEIMMDEVISALYVRTSHCQDGIKNFVASLTA